MENQINDQDKSLDKTGENPGKPEVISPTGDFVDFINHMCEVHGWKTRELDDEHAVLEFTVDQSRSQTLFIFGFDQDVEYSVPSFAAFDSMDKVPHLISSSLLQVNAKMKIGFWCMETIGEKLVFTCMHNAKMSQIDDQLFDDIVKTLVQRVDEFENLLVKMSGEGSAGKEPI